MKISQNLAECSKKVAWLIFCVLACEISIGGGGQWISYYGFSIRMVMFCALCLVSIPFLLNNAKALLHNKALCIFLPFAACLVIGTSIAVLKQNPINFILTDWKGFSFLVLVPISICLLNKIENLKKLLCYLAISSTVLSVISVVLFCFFSRTNGATVNFINNLVNDYHLGGFDHLYAQAYRIFFRSTVWAGFASCYYFYRSYVESDKKKRVLYSCLVAVNVLAIFLSFTRTLYLGAFAGYILLLVLFVVIDPAQIKRLFVFNVSVLILVSLMVAGASVIARVNLSAVVIGRMSIVEQPPITEPPITEPSTTEPSTDEPTQPSDLDIIGEILNQKENSDSIRAKTVAELIAMAQKSIWIGNGVGAFIPSRLDGVEYVYLDLLNKVGLVGLCAFLLPMVFFARLLMKKKHCKDFMVYCTIFSGTAGFYVASIFNPFVNNPIGLMMPVLLSGAASCLYGLKKNEDTKNFEKR